MPSKTDYVINELKAMIEKHEYGERGKLPTGAELCERFGVSLQTIRTAIDRLKAQGFVESTSGSGYYVTPQHQR